MDAFLNMFMKVDRNREVFATQHRTMLSLLPIPPKPKSAIAKFFLYDEAEFDLAAAKALVSELEEAKLGQVSPFIPEMVLAAHKDLVAKDLMHMPYRHLVAFLDYCTLLLKNNPASDDGLAERALEMVFIADKLALHHPASDAVTKITQAQFTKCMINLRNVLTATVKHLKRNALLPGLTFVGPDLLKTDTHCNEAMLEAFVMDITAFRAGEDDLLTDDLVQRCDAVKNLVEGVLKGYEGATLMW